jgi:hypothetical protein
MQKRSDSTDAPIRQWLFRFGVEHKEDIAPRLPLWLEAFDGMDPVILESLFKRALKTCRFFPKIAEILEPIHKAEETAVPRAAEEAWQHVWDIRRLYYNPDMPQALSWHLGQLSERVQQAARAAGVFRDFESVEALHTWAKKRFIESFIAWGEVEQDKFLLPDGEIKNLLAGVAKLKALPAPSQGWNEPHARGLEYAKTPDVQSERAVEAKTAPIRETPPIVDVEGGLAELERQKELILRKYAKTTSGDVLSPELRPVKVSA